MQAFALGQIATLVQDVDPLLHKVVRVQVPGDREARELLEQFFAAEPSPQHAGEDDVGPRL